MTVQSIKNYKLEDAESFFSQIGEKAFRARQLFSWLYEKNITTFSQMTNYSKELRSCLQENFILSPLIPVERKKSTIDGSEKYLFKTHDNHFIESVLLHNDNSDDTRKTICVSSQVGCAMKCSFCNTARIKFIRNLDTSEILDQICQIRRLSGSINDNVVFMGMGEPFLNYENVLRAADIMNYSFGFHISVRRITISTCGILPSIERYIDERRPYNLAISLNDSDPKKRMSSMPVEKRYPISSIASLLNKKFPASRNRVTLEYVMRQDNIEESDAKRIKKLFHTANIKINLIPLNTGGHILPVPSKTMITQFVKYLEIMNVPVSIRKSLGSDIDGACGQLSGKRYEEGECISHDSIR
jgi:23S rRNA (adenine2503-C2)-methyltransferase